MKLRPEELTENGYVLLDSLGHKELVPFIRTYIKARTFFSSFYLWSNLAAVGLISYYFYTFYHSDNYSFDSGITHFSYGLAIAFGLVPIHEYIHVLAYKSQGAEHTAYDVNWKKFYFMALADKFVANRKEFQIVGLAPFIVISTTLLILLCFAGQVWSFTILGVLLTHTAFCSGDFGLLSYFDYHKDKDVVTYDDIENRISYFYGKKL